MSLLRALNDQARRDEIAAAAVAEAEAAVRARSGLRGVAAQLGLDTINRLRPGFLRRHVNAMLPDMARAVEPHWDEGVAVGDPTAHFEANADMVSHDLLAVTDNYVEQASDDRARAVYHRLRARAPMHVSEQMPRIARFIAEHSQSS